MNTEKHNNPNHIAVIMDGNGRWAKARGEDVGVGHKAGVDALRRSVLAALGAGVRWLTVYAFSTENWGRSAGEVGELMGLFSAIVLSEAQELAQRGVRLRFIGDLEGLPTELQVQIREVGAIELVEERMTLTVAMNYSARWDIMQAAAGFSGVKGDGELEDSARVFAERLSTSFLPDVDLVIRTSGEQRLSNFLLWESAYAELYFTDKLWPDFVEADFVAAIDWYNNRHRRFGTRG